VIDATQITKAVLAKGLHEAGGVEANVATGYHAIEFLLWGQDLNGTGPGAGNRPASDFAIAGCTGGNCARRIAYLLTATELLIDDLQEMVDAWGNGAGAGDERLCRVLPEQHQDAGRSVRHQIHHRDGQAHRTAQAGRIPQHVLTGTKTPPAFSVNRRRRWETWSG
jgi:uncharacterized iron-regulated protein